MRHVRGGFMKLALFKAGIRRRMPATLRKFLTVIVVVPFALSACLSDTKPPSECSDSFEKIITAKEIKNKKEAHFDSDDFDFLDDRTIKIDEMIIVGTVIPRHTARSEFDFSFNGIKCGRNDGGRPMNLDCVINNDGSYADDKWDDGRDHKRDDDSKIDKKERRQFCAQAHKFSLNGGLSIALFLLQIKLNKGVVRLMVHGRDSELVEVSLKVKGKKYKTCPQPVPNPNPTPVAPKTTINSYSPSSFPTSSTNMTINFSADQSGVQYFCSLDSAAATQCTSPMNYSGLASGSHNFSVYAKNSAGLMDAQPAKLNWVVDTVAPVITIDNLASLPTLTNSSNINVLFSSNEPVTFKCSLDGSTPASCTSPLSYSNLSEGSHTITISDFDMAGNSSESPAVFQWMIDHTAPIAQIIAADPAAPINNSSHMSMQFAANESATFECSVDNGVFQPCTSPMEINNLVEGSHWFSVRATDMAGNQGLAASYNWTADLSAPIITFGNIVPAPNVITNGRNISVEFVTSETANVMCSLDEASAVPCTSPFTALVDSEGPHSLIVSAADLAGNSSSVHTINWTMDFTPPTISFGVILPSAASYIHSSDFSAEILASEISTIGATLNGSNVALVNGNVVLTGLSEGSYTLVVSSHDSAGNVSQSISHNFNVDITAPTITAQSAISGLTNLDHNTITFNADEGVIFYCNLDDAGFAECTSPLGLSGLASGDHALKVHAKDVSGLMSNEVSLIWSVDTIAPDTFITNSSQNGSDITFTLSSSEVDSTFMCSIDGAVAQSCSSPVRYTNLADTSHSFSAYAVDAAGNMDSSAVSASFTFEKPVTTLTANQTAINSITFNLFSSVTNSTFMCSVDGGTLTPCNSTLTISNLPNGTYQFKAYATDSVGNTDPNGASYTFTFVPPIQSVLIGSTPNTPFTNSTSISFNLGSNHPTATYVCSLDNAAFTACTSPMNYSSLSNGAHTFKFKATDAYGAQDSVGVTYSWTVDTIPPTVLSLSASSTSTSITVTWTTSEPTTTGLMWGPGSTLTNTVPEDTIYTTTHTVKISGLSPNSPYLVKPIGKDRAGNVLNANSVTARTSR